MPPEIALTASAIDEATLRKVRAKIEAAIISIGGNRDAVSIPAISKAARRAHKQLDYILQQKDSSYDGSLWDFEAKAITNFAWLSKLGVSKTDYVSMLLKNPELFLISNPIRLQNGYNKIYNFLRTFHSDSKTLKFLINKPTLWSKDFQKFEKNFNDTLTWLATRGITQDEYGKSVITEGRLLTQKSETLYKNYTAIEELFASYGVAPERWAKAFLQATRLICQKPTTIATNIKNVAEILKPYGLTEEQWVMAAIKAPTLFYYRPQTVATNFKKNAKWAKDYRIKPEELLTSFLKQANLFYRKPISLRHNYEMIRVVTQLPAFTPPKERENHPKKKKAKELGMNNPALERIYALNLGTKNWLLRAAMAELTEHTSLCLYAYLSVPRGQAEKTFVAMLGHDPKKTTIRATNHALSSPKGKKAATRKLNAELQDHASGLRKIWHKNTQQMTKARDTSKNTNLKPIRTKVITTLLPEALPNHKLTAKDKQTLLERAVLSGLLTGYKLV